MIRFLESYRERAGKCNLSQYTDGTAKPWAIVTGASEGIGRQFAGDIAADGLFNIALVSRSNEKMQKVKDVI